MERRRCNHFAVEVEELYLSDAPVTLRIPIRRCRLAERMVALVAEKEEGQEFVRKITIARSELEGAKAQAIRVAFGPDMEAIHVQECTAARCQESCTPSFQMLLRQFGCGEAAEAEIGSGCLEEHAEVGNPDALLTPGNDP